jgi:trehalose 6-phosphate phosphatase
MMLRNDAKPPAPEFFKTLGGSVAGALVLDYDGTLAPFRVDRFAAVPYPGVADLIARIASSGRTRVVLVSGRVAEEVRDLLGIRPFPEIWGLHGRQRLHPDGRSEVLPMKDSGRETLEQAAAWIEVQGLGSRAELKPGSVAIHWRGLAPEEAAEVRERVQPAFSSLAGRAGMALLHFDGGLELRCAEPHKGTAVRIIRSELPPQAPFAYLGDDTTDEDAFRELRGTGALTVLVRVEWRETAAEAWLRPPDELLEFLNRWVKGTEEAQ